MAGRSASVDSVCAGVVTWKSPCAVWVWPSLANVARRPVIPDRGPFRSYTARPAHRAASTRPNPVDAVGPLSGSTAGPAGRRARAGPRRAGSRASAALARHRSARPACTRSVTPAAAASRRPVLDLRRPAPRTARPGRGRAPATPATTLPRSDWWSNEPSPVITRSAASSAASSPVSAGDQADAGGRSRPPRARSAAPRPPAAPPPGQRAEVGRAAGQVALEHAGEALQRGVEQQHVVPVGALLRAVHALAPCRPVSGLSTSVAATSADAAQPGRAVERGRPRQRRPAVRQRVAGRRRAARRRARRACPAPPSLVAEPPSPITTPARPPRPRP